MVSYFVEIDYYGSYFEHDKRALVLGILMGLYTGSAFGEPFGMIVWQEIFGV